MKYSPVFGWLSDEEFAQRRAEIAKPIEAVTGYELLSLCRGAHDEFTFGAGSSRFVLPHNVAVDISDSLCGREKK